MEYVNYIIYVNGDYIEVLAPSSVEKPTNLKGSAMWTETDTGTVYLYDPINKWTEQFSLQG